MVRRLTKEATQRLMDILWLIQHDRHEEARRYLAAFISFRGFR